MYCAKNTTKPSKSLMTSRKDYRMGKNYSSLKKEKKGFDSLMSGQDFSVKKMEKSKFKMMCFQILDRHVTNSENL